MIARLRNHLDFFVWVTLEFAVAQTPRPDGRLFVGPERTALTEKGEKSWDSGSKKVDQCGM
jgi:hypothetical protein